MPTAYWIGNAPEVAELDTILVTAVAVGGTLTGTINGKNVTYTCVTGDTVATAAAAWVELLGSSDAPPEFQEIDFEIDDTTAAKINCTGELGVVFTLTKSQAGGATCTLTNNVTSSTGPNDVSLAANWLRSGANAIPQNGDDVVLSDSSQSLTQRLSALAAVQFASITRYNSFTGQVGLPMENPNGYREYRPTYFQFIGSGTLTATIGLGPGSGISTFEKYDALGQATQWNVIGSPDCRILNTSASSIFVFNGATAQIAMLPAEVATCSGGVSVVNGGILSLGAGVTFAGTLTVQSGSVAFCRCVPTTILSNGGQVTMNSNGGTLGTLQAVNGSTITWNCNTSITSFTLANSSVFNKGGDNRNIVITGSGIDSTCQVIDPWSNIAWTNPTTITGPVQTGPFIFGPGRTVLIA